MSSVRADRTDRGARSWSVPLTSGLIGVVYLVVGLIGHQPWFAIPGFVIMVAFGLVLRRGSRRSETVRGLLDHNDERINAIDLRATAITAIVMILVTLVGFCIDVARGGSGWPYYGIAAVGGGTYVLAVAVLRVRG